MTSLRSNLKYLFMLMAAVTLFSCSSDDDDNRTPAWNDIAGSYNGWTRGTFSYSPTGIATDNEAVSLTLNSDGTMAVKLTSATWGETTVASAAVTESGDSYMLAGDGVTKMGHQGAEAKEYACALTGTVSKDKKSVALSISCPSVMGGTTIVFANGSAPASELLAGTYEGWTKAVFTYNPAGMTTDGEKVSLTANEDGTINVSFNSESWGEATFSNLSVSKDGDSYKFSGEGTTKMGMNGNVKEYACLVEGTISSDKKSYTIVFTAPAVMGGLTITFCEGSAPTEG